MVANAKTKTMYFRFHAGMGCTKGAVAVMAAVTGGASVTTGKPGSDAVDWRPVPVNDTIA